MLYLNNFLCYNLDQTIWIYIYL